MRPSKNSTHARSINGSPPSAAVQMFLIPIVTLLGSCAAFAADAAKPKPAFHYKTDGIEVPPATADEPRVAAFNAETIRAAANYRRRRCGDLGG